MNFFTRIDQSWQNFKLILKNQVHKGKLIERINFPIVETVKFVERLQEVVIKFSPLLPNEWTRVQNFSRTLLITTKQFKNQEGIEAFETLFDTLLYLMKEILIEGSWNYQLREQNFQSSIKVAQLEEEVKILQDQMESCLHLSFLISKEDHEAISSPHDQERIELLDSLQKIIKFANQNQLTILDTYFARSESFINPIELVVIFESEVRCIPPSSNLVKWMQISSCFGDWIEVEEENWRQFRLNKLSEYNQCLQDFQDQVCCDLIRDCPDIIALMPSASSPNDNPPFEPTLLLLKKCCGYNCLSSSIQDYVSAGRITLSNGNTLKTVERDGWFYPLVKKSLSIGNGHGNGCGSDMSLLSECGSLGAFAQDKAGKLYATTCEHVITAMYADEMKYPPGSRDPTIEFYFPSQGCRKVQLMSALMYPNTNFLQCILEKHDSQEMKHFLSIYNRDITVKDIYQYLTRNQMRLEVNVDEILMYSSLEQVCPTNLGQIRVVGDLAAIPLPPDTILREDALFINNKPLVGILQLAEIFQLLQNCEIVVKKIGAMDQLQPVEGVISRPAHLADRSNETPMSSTSPPQPKILYNQLVVSSNHSFGTRCDSGGLIYHEKKKSILIVGTFVGNFSRNLYAVTPAEVIQAHGLQWVTQSTHSIPVVE